jgi:DNA-binding NtrC family response regulator
LTITRVLLDIEIPGLDGLQVLKLLKPRFPDIKIIMVSANKSVSKMMDSIMSEAFDYVPKPIDFDNLEKKILSALGQNN